MKRIRLVFFANVIVFLALCTSAQASVLAPGSYVTPQNTARWYANEDLTGEYASPSLPAYRADLIHGNRIRVRGMNNAVRWINISSGGWLYKHTNYSAQISSSTGRVIIRNSSGIIRRYTSAVGSSRSATPKGKWMINDKIKYSSSKDLRLYGPRVLAFDVSQKHGPYSGALIAFHHGYGGDYGHRVSNGCVRLPQQYVDYLWSILPIGTAITIT